MKKHRHLINILLTTVQLFLILYLFIGVWYFTPWPYLEIRHYIALFFTLSIFVTLFINHNLFNLMLGLTLVIGNFGGLSLLYPIETFFVGFHIGSIPIPLYWGQPLYSLLLFAYIIFNKEFYIGIVTKEYWADFLTRTQDLEAVFTVIKTDNNTTENKNSADNKI